MKPTVNTKLRIGLIINPFAGIGGKVGLKGSDGEQIRAEAFARGAVAQAENRTRMALGVLLDYKSLIEWHSVSGAMGANLLDDLGYQHTRVYQAPSPSTDTDTCNAAKAMLDLELDLILFAGGDGTARNICQTVDTKIPVLGIPAGVKIHSGVYALTPLAAAEVIKSLLQHELVSCVEASVMDIDEDAFRSGTVRAKKYGEMLVPAEHEYIQSTKSSSSELHREDESLVLGDIAEYIIDEFDEDCHYLIGSGTSCAVIMEQLDLPNTLLGVDWIYQNKLMQSDLTESDILKLLENHPQKVKAVITIIGGQGHIIGRGNQQLSAKVLEKLGKKNLLIIATKTKLNHLSGRPLIVDSDSIAINHAFSGVYSIITGYDDRILYKAGLLKYSDQVD